MKDLLIATLILSGAGVMLLSTLSSRRILTLLKGNELIRLWQVLSILMMFFFVGYLAAFGLVVTGYTDLLVTLAGVVFFFGALFVYIVVRLGLVTIKDLLKKTEAIHDFNAQLETNVKQRTMDLERRISQIRTSAEIARQSTSSLDPQSILDQIVNLLRTEFDLYYVGAFLKEEDDEYAVLRAGTGGAGAKMLALHHQLKVDDHSMVGWAIRNQKARIASDVGIEAIRFNNPHLPLTRSEIALPMISRNTVIGALSLQSSQSNAFDDDDIVALQGVADVLATALDNARLFQRTEASLKEIRQLHSSYMQEAWADTLHSGGDFTYSASNTDLPEGTSQIELPLLLRDQVIGQITLDTDGAGLSPEELALIDSITTQTTLALENARLIEETQRRASQEQLVNQITSRFSRTVNVDGILKITVEELGKLPSVMEASIYLKPADTSIDLTSLKAQEK